MNHRRLAFFAAALPMVVIAASIPGIGTGLSIYLACGIWAVAGFRWFVLGVLATFPLDSTNLYFAMSYTNLATSPAYTQAVQQLASNPTYGPLAAGLEVGLLAGFGLLIYAVKRDVRRMLVKRLGSRVP